MEDVVDNKLKDLERLESGNGGEGSGDIVEESGPVQYVEADEEGGEEEEDGLNDEEIEKLVYEDDPLLIHSDCDDEYEEY